MQTLTDTISFTQMQGVEDFIVRNRLPLAIFLIGLLAFSLGIFALRGKFVSENKVEVLESTTGAQVNDFLIVEVTGAVTNPGVYKLSKDSRVEDALVAAGGLSANADRNWIEKTLNRAAKIVDGQKVYIPKINESLDRENTNSPGVYQSDTVSQGSGLTNINSSSQKELEALNGIGPVYAQKIIEQRPYSNIEDLLSKKVIPKNTYDKIKNEISVY